jgi:3-hydroxymyristoyl/3-hydroxydecanoyl-(acyl carrier protein) dehydratase
MSDVRFFLLGKVDNLYSMAPLPHRFPFFFIDRAERIVPGEEGVFSMGWSADNYYLSERTPASFFQALLLEMAAQAAGMVLLALDTDWTEDKPRGGYLLGLNRVTFPHPPTGKERLIVSVKKIRSLGKMLRFSSQVTEGENLLVQGELTLWEESYTSI